MARTTLAAVLLLILTSGCSGQLDGGQANGSDPSGPGAGLDGTDPGLTPGEPGGGQAGDGAMGPDEQPWMPPSDGSAFTGPIVAGPAASTRFSRLTHAQWERSVRDLLGLTQSLGLASSFVGEPLLSTFDNNGGVLSVSADLWLDYQRAAETVGSMVANDPQIIARILPQRPADADESARAFIEAFGLHAYRRPLSEGEVTRLLELWNQGPELVGNADPFLSGVELVVSFMLQSPHFLYRTELSDQVVDGRIPLNGYEIASRLSYGLTGSMPDAALFTAAAAGTLLTRDELMAQAARLLATPGATEAIGDFHAQLLNMREYQNVHKDDARFGEGIGAELFQEGVRFAEQTVLGPNGTLSELLTAPYTYGNSHIAALYGDDASGAVPGDVDSWQRIDLDPSRRAGLLTQMGFLTSNAEGITPNSIIRGVHISRRVLCVELPPPPNMIPPLPELSADQTNRQRVELLTGDQACSGCHGVLINPLGFALEHYDGVGQYRDSDNGQPVDASASYSIDGQTVSYDGAVQFAQTLAQSNQAHECYARRWAEYLYGRDFDRTQISEQNLVLQGGALSHSGARVTDLIAQLVATDAFTSRLPAGATP